MSRKAGKRSSIKRNDSNFSTGTKRFRYRKIPLYFPIPYLQLTPIGVLQFLLNPFLSFHRDEPLKKWFPISSKKSGHLNHGLNSVCTALLPEIISVYELHSFFAKEPHFFPPNPDPLLFAVVNSDSKCLLSPFYYRPGLIYPPVSESGLNVILSESRRGLLKWAKMNSYPY
ncbi:hypothetical protein AVEN_104107-1 [Araneus ventricosus]|uniref:Uncharacterized protein n=1 Tax=Araneus ventricosus TaxID=182803 RepID=A0A4Y2JAD5_ARAVE|nr:hypothetical protein AVEN_104107-1 [Araneus ventricosus]